MKKNVGLWIDHRKAVILVLAERTEEVHKIESNMEKQVRFRGGVRGCRSIPSPKTGRRTARPASSATTMVRS